MYAAGAQSDGGEMASSDSDDDSAYASFLDGNSSRNVGRAARRRTNGVAFVSAMPHSSDKEDLDSDVEDNATNEAILEREVPSSMANNSAQNETLNKSARSSTNRLRSQHPAATASHSVPPKTTADPFLQRGGAVASASAAVTTAYNAGGQKSGAGIGFGAGTASNTTTTDGSGKPNYSSFGGFNKDVARDRNFASWTKTTSGFGMKMLEKMGWSKGKGLGVQEQGIARPIDVKLRQKGAGLQDSGERTEQSRQDFKNKDDEREKEEKFEEEMSQWRVDPNVKRTKKPKYKYKTVDELAEEGASSTAGISTSSIKVVDMSGPQVRVLEGYDKIRAGAPDVHTSDTSPLPELQRELNRLVTTATTDVQQLSQRVRKEEARQRALRNDISSTAERVKKEQRYIARLADILLIIEGCRQRAMSTDTPMDLDECREMFLKLKQSYPDEYASYGLSALTGALLYPLLRRELDGWDALTAPADRVSFIRDCRTLLDDGSHRGTGGADHSGDNLDDDNTMSMFETLCWDHVVPKLRAGIASANLRDPTAVVAMLATWHQVLPAWMGTNLYTQVVLPRLRAEVDAWDPRSDAQPINLWLHPWLPLAGDVLSQLYPTIRFKLGTCLQAWHPSDASAMGVLAPWKKVFPRKDMTSLLQRSILPKLELVLRDFKIAPDHQDIRPLQWVLAWKDLLAPKDMALLLCDYLLPKLLHVLAAWLSDADTTNGAKYGEIARWYSGWRAEVGDEVVRGDHVHQRRLRLQFCRAADMMHRSAVHALGGRVTRHLVLTPPTARASQHTQPSAIAMAKHAHAHAVGSVRDLVQRMADTRGIVFMPKDGRTTSDGSQVYAFGRGTTLYFNQGVIYARNTAKQRDSGFLPTSIDELERMAL
eukprot:m.313163 g.313163  ORF g.313163 m.313163 type:complete len:879 (-) comp20253_c0_seq8:312-2948(-)